jgi:U32 family peptidase
MLIVAGLDHSDDVQALVNAGAREFYAGIVPEEWTRQYGFSISPNRRETPRPNLTSYDELARLVRDAHGLQTKVFLTVNAHEYTSQLLGDVRGIIEGGLSCGVDGLIIADPGLLLQLDQWEIETTLIISGDMGISNSRSLDWLLPFPRVKRIIFPRHLSMEQMARVTTHHPRFEYETFVMNERCFFDGAHCFSTHGRTPLNFCANLFDSPWTVVADASFPFDECRVALDNVQCFREREQINRLCELREERRFHAVPCGLCSIPGLRRAGVGYLKVVSRGVEPELKRLMIGLVNSVLRQDLQPEQIVNLYSRAFSGYYREWCDAGYNCYRVK